MHFKSKCELALNMSMQTDVMSDVNMFNALIKGYINYAEIIQCDAMQFLLCDIYFP